MDVTPIVRSPKPQYRLTDAITAFALLTDSRGIERCGRVCELPEGANLEICGSGFNERTVKARYANCYYHVFARDLVSATHLDPTADAEDLATSHFAATA